LPAEQVALRRLSVFVGGFDAASACTVIGNEVGEIATVTNFLAELAAKSLLDVRVSDDQVTYQLPATVGAYAFEKLKDSGEGDEISRRYARVLHGSAATMEPQHLLSDCPERRSRFLIVLRSQAVRGIHQFESSARELSSSTPVP
jgi:predicted ATPase